MLTLLLIACKKSGFLSVLTMRVIRNQHGRIDSDAFSLFSCAAEEFGATLPIQHEIRWESRKIKTTSKGLD